MLKRHFLWIIYGVFVATALWFKPEEPLFFSDGPLPWGKPIVWAVLIAFLAYTFYCHMKADFFETMKITGRYHWTKQIGVDLYLGVGLIACVIFFNHGLLVLSLWLIPLLIYANLATLLYLALHYDLIISNLVTSTQ